MAGIFVLLLVGVALAASEGFSIDWWTVGGGGGTSQGGDYALNGTIGQPDAGPTLSGGEYTVTGGFWGETSPYNFWIYLPVINR